MRSEGIPRYLAGTVLISTVIAVALIVGHEHFFGKAGDVADLLAVLVVVLDQGVQDEFDELGLAHLGSLSSFCVM